MAQERCVIPIVDDDENVSAYAEDLLKGYGYESVSFSEPEKALEFLAWNADRVDLIISDIVMPGLNGGEVAKEAAKLKPGIAIILLSRLSETLPEAAALTNVKDILEKPLAKTELLQAIEGVLQRCPSP
jgi:DNA-binding NtrC family response regulator